MVLSLTSRTINTNANVKRLQVRQHRRFCLSKIFVLCFCCYYYYYWIITIKIIFFHRLSSSPSPSSLSLPSIASRSMSSRMTARLFCSGWKISHCPQQSRQPRLRQYFTRHHQKSSLRRRTIPIVNRANAITSTNLFLAKKNNNSINIIKLAVGDLVSVIPRNNNQNTATDSKGSLKTQTGEIESIRGGGWYSIRIDDNENVIKCRGNQLQRTNSSTATIENNRGIATSKYNTTADRSTIFISPKRSNNDNTKNNNSLKIDRPSLSQTTNYKGTLHLEVDSDSENQPPVSQLTPTIYDLDAAISKGCGSDFNIEQKILQQAAHHATYKKWVVFTDLHCSPTTLDTCLEVLDIVHETAIQQKEKCGVLFLGDFWHHRGTLRVDCLNAILRAFRSWQVPMIMIPGNHDQITLGGQNHSLTPFENAYRVDGDNIPGPLILSHPTIFRKALFIPHIRDMNIMKSIVQSNEAEESSAMFVHAEIRGALMNDMMVSTNGISPSVFPPHKHVYSGHFHKPHSIQTSSSSVSTNNNSNINTDSSSPSTIEYLGSPYQISLAEAQQEKQLVILDAERGWQCEQRIPVRVGRCHFRSSSLEELQNFQVYDEENNRLITEFKESIDDESAAEKTIRVKKGDRIVMHIPKKEQRRPTTSSNDTALKSKVQLLRDQGVMVEVREVSSDNKHSFPTMLSNDTDNSINVEEMSPESTWKAYLKDAEIRNEFINENDHDALLEIGLEILEENETSMGGVQNKGIQYDLRLLSTSVTGFGPFEDTVKYPLDNRGLVLLRGSNSDSGPDSNGTGKSSLAMATLWALTGSLDARPASDLKVADVINDNSKVARVTVEGLINNVPFVISRTKAASKSDLVFHVDDADLTTQSTKETQALIEERLGVDAHILTRVAFHGQHGMNDLLEATDAKLKDELSLLVPLDLWQQAASIARLKSRLAKKKIDEFEGMVRLRKADIDTLSNRVTRSKESRDYKQKHLIESKERLNIELKRIQILLDRTVDSSNVEILQVELKDVSSKIHRLNDLHESTMAEKEKRVKPLQEKLSQVRDIVASMIRKNNSFEMNVLTCKMSLDTSRESISQIEGKWSLDLSHGIPSVLKPPEQCPTCLQPLLSNKLDNSFENAQKMMEIEIKKGHKDIESAEHAFKEASLKASECLNALEAQREVFNQLQSDLETTSSKWNAKFTSLQEKLKERRVIQNNLTLQLSMVVKESQLLAQREAAKVSFNEEKINVAYINEAYENLNVELSTAVEFLKKIGVEKEKEENNLSVLSIVGERFGHRGVQTYMLQNVVESLQRTSQNYLDHLSDGSQRLELSLDAGDKIVRNAFVRGTDGEFKHRPLSTLSGGQWRRCSLALSFAFTELVASRGRLRSSLLVLDEPLTHLDRSGRTKFGELVRKMLLVTQNIDQELSGIQISTAIVILQDLSAEELEEAFDGIDTVIRKDGRSYLRLDEISSSTEIG